jgi:hypothetical protein
LVLSAASCSAAAAVTYAQRTCRCSEIGASVDQRLQRLYLYLLAECLISQGAEPFGGCRQGRSAAGVRAEQDACLRVGVPEPRRVVAEVEVGLPAVVKQERAAPCRPRLSSSRSDGQQGEVVPGKAHRGIARVGSCSGAAGLGRQPWRDAKVLAAPPAKWENETQLLQRQGRCNRVAPRGGGNVRHGARLLFSQVVEVRSSEPSHAGSGTHGTRGCNSTTSERVSESGR